MLSQQISPPNICIENAALAYNGKMLFSHLNLHLPAGKWISLLGPSGIGKSSLLRLLAGLVNKKEIIQATIRADNHLPVAQQLAYMPQTDVLLPWLTVLGNVTLCLKLHRHKKNDYEIQMAKAKLLLEKVGLANAHHLYPHQLSGGMRQRAALVRTLMEEKTIVLMDEPFSALDAITRYKLQELAADLLKEKTVLFITHDPSEALRLGHEIYIMHGAPATLKHVLQLTSPIPRDYTDPTLLNWQALLFQQLTETSQ